MRTTWLSHANPQNCEMIINNCQFSLDRFRGHGHKCNGNNTGLGVRRPEFQYEQSYLPDVWSWVTTSSSHNFFIGEISLVILPSGVILFFLHPFQSHFLSSPSRRFNSMDSYLTLAPICLPCLWLWVGFSQCETLSGGQWTRERSKYLSHSFESGRSLFWLRSY